MILFDGNTNTGYLTSLDGKKQSFKFETGKWLKMEFYINHSSYVDHFSDTRKLVIDNKEVVSWGSYSGNRSQDISASNTILSQPYLQNK